MYVHLQACKDKILQEHRVAVLSIEESMILVPILVFLSFLATSPARAAASDCEAFMYGNLAK